MGGNEISMAKTENNNEIKKRKKSGLWDTIRTVAYAVIAAMVLRTVALEPFNIPSGSMIPTLMVGDYLFVSKYSYGYSKFSLPWSLNLFSGRIFGSAPERGDVAVFRLPRDNDIDYIKRIVGLPGDKIQVSNGILKVNDMPVEQIRVGDFRFTNAYGRQRTIAQFEELLPNGVAYNILDANPNGTLDNTQIYLVPEGHYFAMGDNRDNSLDSRVGGSYGVGFIPAENLIGRAEFIFYSTRGGADIWEVWKWGDVTRLDRLFKAIH